MKVFFGCTFSLVILLQVATSFAQEPNGSATAPSMMQHDKVEIINCETINSQFREFSPAYFIKGIVYLTTSQNIGRIDPNLKERYFELLYSELDENGMPKDESFGYSKTLSSNYHEGPLCFSRDWEVIYFSRNNLKNGQPQKNESDDVTLKIYRADRGDKGWQNIQELPFNSDQFRTCHPTIDAENKRLYFSSDRPGGYGGMDIWYVEMVGDSMGTPMNAGPVINSPGHEAFPYIHASGVLFYASNGHNTMGGLDLFMASGLNGKTTVKNLGPPFNTVSDDFGLIMNDEGTEGFFSSDRVGGEGLDDIYKFKLEEDLISKERSSYSVTVVVRDATTEEVIPGANVKVFENTSEGLLLGSNIYDAEMTPSPIDPDRLELKLIKKEGQEVIPPVYTDDNGEYSASMDRGKEYVVIVTQKGYNAGKKEYLHKAATDGEVTVLLQPMQCLPIEGMVREEGSLQRLSGVAVEVMNQCDDTKRYFESDKDGLFTVCLPCDCAFTLTLKKSGYKDATEEVPEIDCSESYPVELLLTKSAREEPQKESVLYNDDELEEGALILLENIYYDYNKATIRQGAAEALDQLAVVMEKYPDMEILLIAHTDSRGRDGYNMDLSERRAKNARQYLVARGIDVNRIIPVGRGESQLRNECADGVPCTEEEHQKNRRTEVKILYLGEKVNVEVQDNEPETIDGK